MYEAFFGFRERPFGAAPQAKCYFPSPAAEAARQSLARCVERAEGVGLLVGPAGTGKSLLCQALAEQFRGQLEVALLASGRLCTRRALLQAILFELGLPYRGIEEGDLRLSLIDHIAPRRPDKEVASAGLLLIVDEAHTLPLRLIEELRLITNLVRNGQPRVRLLLAGGPQLEERFANPKLEAFNQRIAARCYLEGMDRQQTADYVRHQVDFVGGKTDRVFANDALDAIYQATGGIGRLINQLCDHALLLAFAGGVRRLNAGAIEEAWSDLQQLPTPWNAAQGAPAREDSPGVIEFGELDDEAGDDLPAAVPFRPAAAESFSAGKESTGAIQRGRAALSAAGAEFEPVAGKEPEIELVFPQASNPFREAFDEEEVVIDRYTTIETGALAARPRVRSTESRELGAMLAPHAVPSPPSVAVAPATWPGGTPSEQYKPQPPRDDAPSASGAPSTTDDDLIVIEETAEPVLPSSGKPASRVERREYRQLFAQLRRG